ncbi:hypothetical protein H0H93_006408 [Arthromyces matolae]|nr:hypothetical protein H0H93_006408 [Arthromyces matolae]
MTKLNCLPASSTPTTPERFSPVRVQVSGNLIALLLKEVDSDLQSHLEIWDWVRTPQISCKTKSRSGIEDFTFLSEDSFLLVRSIGSLETFTFPTPMTEACAPVCQYSYLLPLLSDGYFYWYITISSNPTPAFAPRSTGSTSRGKQLYSPKPTERIHVCSLCIFEPAATDEMQHVHCFIFFFNPQSLLHPPEDWIKSAKEAKQRKYTPHYAYTAQPLTFGTLPTVPSHTDVGVQTPDPASSSSSFQTDISPTTAVSLLSLPAHPRPILP